MRPTPDAPSLVTTTTHAARELDRGRATTQDARSARRPWLASAALAAAMASLTACGNGAMSTEDGSSPHDGGMTRDDSGSSPHDGGSTGMDAGTPPSDGGTPPGDGGTPPGDGGPAPQDGGAPTLGPEQHGVATFYDADGSGNCSFDPSPGDLNVAAMDAPQYANSAVCGECVRVQGPNGAVTVRIVDKCPECESGHLDLSAQAFAQIADPVQGRVDITWQPVACEVEGNVSYRFKEGSSQWWTAIQVRNSRLPIQSLEAQVSGSWVALDRQDYNYFVYQSGIGPGPYTLRVTAQDGQQITDTGIVFHEAQVVPGGSQFH